MNVWSLSKTILFSAILLCGIPALADVHGVLRVVKGDVQIKSGQNGQMTKARLGQEVFPKDTIITGKDARAKIVMIDNNEINVSPESNVEIQNYEFNPAQNKKDVLLNVLYGKVRSKVEQKYDGKTSKFQVKTPSAVAGVRGTDFAVGYNSATQGTNVTTFRGKVDFGLPGPGGTITNSVSVTPGKTANNVAGSAPGQPTTMTKAQLAQADNDSKAEGGSDSRQPSSDKKGGNKGNNNGGNGNNSSSNSGASNSNANSTSAAPSSSTASNSGSESSSGASATGSSSGGDSSRAPASTAPSAPAAAPPPAPSAGGGMIQASDLPASAPSIAENIPQSPTTTTVANRPTTTTPPATVPNPTACALCNASITNNSVPTTATVKINH